MGEEYLLEQKYQTAALPKPIPAWMTVHEAGNLEHNVQPAGDMGWRVSFQVTVCITPRHLVWSQSLLCSSASLAKEGSQLLLLTLAGRALMKLVSFRNFLKLF